MKIILWLYRSYDNMMEIIWEFHRWYDKLQEPYRLLMALILVSAGIIPISIRNPYTAIGGIIYIFALLISRIYYVDFLRWKKPID